MKYLHTLVFVPYLFHISLIRGMNHLPRIPLLHIGLVRAPTKSHPYILTFHRSTLLEDGSYILTSYTPFECAYRIASNGKRTQVQPDPNTLDNVENMYDRHRKVLNDPDIQALYIDNRGVIHIRFSQRR